MKNTSILFGIASISILLFISGCTQSTLSSSGNGSSTITGTAPASPEEVKPWMDFQLKDVLTGENFKISDFKGKKVLFESFAVWCPTCTGQQRITKELEAELGEDVVSISLDTDPNENEDVVRNHAMQNGFDWYYAVAPAELSQLLIDEFGLGIVSAPSVPMVLVCEDQSFRMLQRGIKSKDVIKAQLAQGC